MAKVKALVDFKLAVQGLEDQDVVAGQEVEVSDESVEQLVSEGKVEVVAATSEEAAASDSAEASSEAAVEGEAQEGEAAAEDEAGSSEEAAQ